MGIFSRLAQLIKSNLNDLISRSEDPEKMLNQVVLDMNNQLVEAKKQVAASIADEKRLAKQFDQEAANAQEWERKAMLALRAGNEPLAKEALARKREYDELAATLKDQWTKQKTAVEQLKKALRLLNDKIEEAKRKRNVLIARKKRAEAQRAIQETMSGLRDQSAFETFDRMSQKIDQIEAEAEAESDLAEEYTGDTLSSQFQQLERTHSGRRRSRRPQAQDGDPPAGRGARGRRSRSRLASRRRPRRPRASRRRTRKSWPPRSRSSRPSRQQAEEKRKAGR